MHTQDRQRGKLTVVASGLLAAAEDFNFFNTILRRKDTSNEKPNRA
jgi:hypothetical protein